MQSEMILPYLVQRANSKEANEKKELEKLK